MAPRGRGGKGKGKGKQQTHRKTSASTSNPAASDPAASDPDVGRIFPSEVIFNILSRLPVKSLLRFRCASKQWRKLVSFQTFVSAHLRRSPDALLIHANTVQAFQGGPNPVGHAIYAYGPPNPQSGEQSTVDRIHNFPGSDASDQPLEVVGAAPNGVVCIVRQGLAQSFTLWNPATRSSLRIPEPDVPNPDDLIGASAGFGFDPSTNEYALIRIVRFHQHVPMPDVVQLFNFRTGRWARLDNDISGAVYFRVATGTCEAVVNGVPYWRAWVDEVDIGVRLKLVWFDVRNSVFIDESMQWPTQNEMQMGEIRAGYLGVLVWNKTEPDSGFPVILSVWTREPEFGLWSRTYRVFLDRLPVEGRLVGFHVDGEIVQEIVVGGQNGTPYLCMMKIPTVDGVAVMIQDFCRLDGAWSGTCKVVSYRESLTRLPKIGHALI